MCGAASSRIFTAGVVGSALAVCGVVFQAIRNPWPSLIPWVSRAGIARRRDRHPAGHQRAPMALICFAGCCLSIGVVLGPPRSGLSNSMLILAGIIMSFLFSSVVMFIFAVASSREVHSSILWLMGSLSAPPAGSVKMLLMALPVMLSLPFFARDLNLLSLGDEQSYYLGLDAKRAKTYLLLGASLITGVCIALSGIIAFVGLVIPHAVRGMTGADHHSLIPCSMLAGGGFLILSDTLSQIIIRPLELPVGVITGIVGGLFFVIYLLKARPAEVS